MNPIQAINNRDPEALDRCKAATWKVRLSFMPLMQLDH